MLQRNVDTMAERRSNKAIDIYKIIVFLTYFLRITKPQATSPVTLNNQTTFYYLFGSLNNTNSGSTTTDFPQTPPTDGNDTFIIHPPATDGNFFDELNIWDILKSEDVQFHLNRSDTVEYIDSFPNEFQRNLIKETLRYCPYIQLCNFSLGLRTPPMGMIDEEPCCEYCSCSPDCVQTGSCCPDFPGVKVQPVTNAPETESCMLIEIRKLLANKSVHDNYVLAVQSCPLHTDSDLSYQCSGEFQNFPDISFEDVIPLSDVINNKTYRNKHCAVCNGADINELSAWEPRLNCPAAPVFSSANDLLSAIINGTSQCTIHLLPPLLVNIEYCSDLIETCNTTGLWTDFEPGMASACNSYESTITVRYGDKTYLFKNPFCAICNGLIPTEYLCRREIFDPGLPFAFSGLLRFTSTDPGDEDVSTSCGKDFVYDDISNECRKVTCSPYRIFKKDHCVVFLESTDSAGYRLTSLLLPSVAINLDDIYELMPGILSEFENIIESSIEGYICAKQTLMTTRNVSTDNGGDLLMVESVELQYDILSQNEHKITESVNLLLDIDGVLFKRNDSKFDDITFTVLLKDESMYFQVPYAFYSNWSVPSNTPVDLQELLWFTFPYNLKTFVPYFTWNHMSAPCITQMKIHPLLTLKACPMISINISKFGLSETRLGFRFGQEEDIVLRLSDYFLDGTTSEIKVCIETYTRVFGKFKSINIPANLSAELILSIICISISIVCLLISLITYCVLPQLQTLPGKNNMALILSLLTAQSIYLVGSYAGFDSGTTACKLIGGLTHFFWLLSIFWMNACTLHMFRVLLQTRDMAHSNSSLKHLQYHLYCIISSIIFVLVNILVSTFTSDYTDIGYGRSSCYISEQRLIEYSFGIPTGIVIIANISMFLAIIIKLKRAPTVSKNVKNERNYFFVFAKLSTITGATWLFGFLYMWSGVEAFSYTFIILNGGQGLFLMLAFVVNKRTFDMMRNRKDTLTTSIFGRTQSSKMSSNSIGGSSRKE